MSIKSGYMSILVLPIPTTVQNISRLTFIFTKGLNELCDWLARFNCKDVCMESTGKYWILVFNVLGQHELWVTLSHPKYTKPTKGNKINHKDVTWICNLYM